MDLVLKTIAQDNRDDPGAENTKLFQANMLVLCHWLDIFIIM